MTGYASRYLSKFYQTYASWSATPTADTDTDIEEDYCIVKCTIPSSVQSTLELIERAPVNWSLQGQDIIHEFYLVHDKLYHTCHQFDSCRITEQFSNTHFKMGSELKLLIQFITERYSDNRWLSLIGLLMVGCQVLITPPQVKKELLHVTLIGRYLILEMNRTLAGISTIVIDTKFKSAIMEVFGCKEWLPLLKDTCLEFSKHDKDWELNQEYHQVVFMATQLLSQGNRD